MTFVSEGLLISHLAIYIWLPPLSDVVFLATLVSYLINFCLYMYVQDVCSCHVNSRQYLLLVNLA